MLVYIPTGQKILFRGLDKPLKVTSITVTTGALCWAWVEEAYEITEDAFNKLDMSIRGAMPKGLFKQLTLIFNPWSEQSWLKKRFFDHPDANTLAMTTTYACNEWLDAQDIAVFESMKVNNPRRYRIEGLGEWGVSEGLIYSNVESEQLDPAELMKRGLKAFYGLDFGFTDPTAFVGGFADLDGSVLYICYELYMTNVTNEDIAREIKALGLKREPVMCDAAEPKSIAELQKLGVNAKAAVKGPDSVNYGIQKLQNYKIIYDPSCSNFEHEIKNYCWGKGADGKPTNKPDHEFSHMPDALRYGIVELKPSKHVHPSNLAFLRGTGGFYVGQSK